MDNNSTLTAISHRTIVVDVLKCVKRDFGYAKGVQIFLNKPIHNLKISYDNKINDTRYDFVDTNYFFVLLDTFKRVVGNDDIESLEGKRIEITQVFTKRDLDEPILINKWSVIK